MNNVIVGVIASYSIVPAGVESVSVRSVGVFDGFTESEVSAVIEANRSDARNVHQMIIWTERSSVEEAIAVFSNVNSKWVVRKGQPSFAPANAPEWVSFF